MLHRTKNGIDLAYRIQGEGRLLVFLHPIGVRGAFWRPVIDELGNGYRTLTVDLRGHGESSVNEGPFSLDDLSDDVAELISMHGHSDTIAIGCSFGGMVAQGLAIKMPHNISGLVLAGTSHRQTPESRIMMEKRATDALKGMPSVADGTIERWFPQSFRDSRPDVVARVRSWLLATDPTVFSRGWMAISALNYEDALSGMNVPTLLVRGSADASTPLPRMQSMAELIPHARFVSIEGAGHFAPMEEPHKFAQLIRDFIDQDVKREETA